MMFHSTLHGLLIDMHAQLLACFLIGGSLA